MLATLSLRVHSPSAPRLAANVAAAMPAPSVKITGNAIPLGREQNSATLDARHGYLVVFGGRQATKIFDDVWRLDVPRGRAVSSWTPVPTEGPAPRARWGHTAVYDTTTDAMIVFGGAFGFSSPCTNQTWILHNASGHFGRPSWQLLQPSGTRPGPRANHTATYDAKRNRMFVFGGHDCVALRFGDTWILEHANGKGGVPVWRLLRPDTKGALPVGRSNHIAGYSSAGDAFFIYGGVTSDGEILRDGWRLRGTVGDGNAHWERLRIQDAPPRGFYAGAFDLEKFRVLLFGGLTPEGRQIAQLWSLQLPRSSTSGSFWRQVGAFEPAAVPGSTAPAVFDPIGHELLLFGGHGQGGERYDTWSFAVR